MMINRDIYERVLDEYKTMIRDATDSLGSPYFRCSTVLDECFTDLGGISNGCVTNFQAYADLLNNIHEGRLEPGSGVMAQLLAIAAATEIKFIEDVDATSDRLGVKLLTKPEDIEKYTAHAFEYPLAVSLLSNAVVMPEIIGHTDIISDARRRARKIVSSDEFGTTVNNNYRGELAYISQAVVPQITEDTDKRVLVEFLENPDSQ